MAKRRRLKSLNPVKRNRRLTLREAIERIRHAKIYATYSIPPVMKRFKEPIRKQIERQIKETAPKAKIEYLPRGWLVRGKVKDPWQDIKVSNITVGESLELASVLSPQAVTFKG